MANNIAAQAASGIVTLYEHPDGPRIDFDDWALTVTNEDGQSASCSIGPLGLIELADKLMALGRSLGGGL